MSEEKPIAWETHPVSPERKAELIAAGFRIVDARFKPEGEPVATAVQPVADVVPDAETPTDAEIAQPAKRRGRPPKARTDAGEQE